MRTVLRTYLALAAVSAATAALTQAASPLLAEPAAEVTEPHRAALPGTPPPPPAGPQIIALEVVPYSAPQP